MNDDNQGTGQPGPTTPPVSTDTTGGGDPAATTFTQEALAKIVGREVAQAKRAATTDALKALGFATTDEASAFVKAARDAELAAMTEADRVKALAEAERAAAADERAALARERHDLAVQAALSRAGATGDLARLARMIDAAPGSDGTALDVAVADLKTSLPALFGTAGRLPSSDSPGGGPGGSPGGSTDPFAAGAALAKARNDATASQAFTI